MQHKQFPSLAARKSRLQNSFKSIFSLLGELGSFWLGIRGMSFARVYSPVFGTPHAIRTSSVVQRSGWFGFCSRPRGSGTFWYGAPVCVCAQLCFVNSEWLRGGNLSISLDLSEYMVQSLKVKGDHCCYIDHGRDDCQKLFASSINIYASKSQLFIFSTWQLNHIYSYFRHGHTFW